MRFLGLLFLVARALAHCARYPAVVSAPVPEPDRIQIRDQVRELIRKDCGSCHTKSLPTAKPGALAVFDLEEPEWLGRMTKAQLEKKFTSRLGGTIPESQRDLVVRLLGSELARR